MLKDPIKCRNPDETEAIIDTFLSLSVLLLISLFSAEDLFLYGTNFPLLTLPGLTAVPEFLELTVEVLSGFLE